MDKMQAYRDKAEARLKEIGANIDRLKAKGEKAGADLRLETQKEIEQLKQRRRDIGARLEKLKSSGGAAFDEVKAGIESAVNELKAAVEKAAGKFK